MSPAAFTAVYRRRAATVLLSGISAAVQRYEPVAAWPLASGCHDAPSSADHSSATESTEAGSDSHAIVWSVSKSQAAKWSGAWVASPARSRPRTRSRFVGRSARIPTPSCSSIRYALA